jgi:hypothetical protein
MGGPGNGGRKPRQDGGKQCRTHQVALVAGRCTKCDQDNKPR